MVRNAKALPDDIECSKRVHFRSGICQPRDNIGVSCMFSAENGPTDAEQLTGLRRRYPGPKDNLGIACLPSVEAMRLRDIPEVSEYDSSEETYAKFNDVTLSPQKQKAHPTSTKITRRGRRVAPEENLENSCRHISKDVAIGQVRLRAGEDGCQVTRHKIRSRSNTGGRSKIEGVKSTMTKGNVDFFRESEKRVVPSGKMRFKSTLPDIGISNIRRPTHNPTQPRKPIIPKDNIGFSCCHLSTSLSRSSVPKTLATQNLKSETVKKIDSLPKSPSHLSGRPAATLRTTGFVQERRNPADITSNMTLPFEDVPEEYLVPCNVSPKAHFAGPDVLAQTVLFVSLSTSCRLFNG
ncbi:uncharacterized protein LOC124174567 [Neodiprion fabricii]|uniref:uncharacterized protein LOC124174567 n=1 Tax=Neodiprion fabricii TaxID=2872261 RepID=UPI001ED90630|nr:uncharacterized protein LOC124174567 [Neodiprion fabricii]